MILSSIQKIEYENKIRSYVLLKSGKLEENWRYVNSETKIKITCDKGHEWSVLWRHLKQGSWCPECAGQITHEEDVLKFIEEKGGKVDPGWKYKNEKTPFWVTCAKGHRWHVPWSSLKHDGSWCHYCAGHTVDVNEVKKFIEKKGGVLDKDWEFVRYNKKFWLTCENDHKWETTWNVIQQGHWCPECARKAVLQRNFDSRRTEDTVREYISGKEGKLDPEWKYINNHEKFWIECDQGHRWQAVWGNISQGHWCPYCMKTIVLEKDVRTYIENKGGHLSDDWEFVKSKENFKIQCGQGHYFQACWDKIRLGQWCPFCYGNDQPNDSEVKGLIAAKKGELDSDWKYVNSFSRFWITCRKGHRWQTRWNTLKQGGWCPKCKETVSENKFRGTIERILSAPFPKQKPEWLRSPLTGRPLELDGYNQDLKVAFEYQGPYHYQLGDTSQKRRDEIKVQKCTENNVILIRIPYWVPMTEWESEITNQISNKG